MSIKTYFSLFFLAYAFTNFAQDMKSLPQNELDKQFTPGNNSILNKLASKYSDKRNHGCEMIRNAVEFNPTMLVRKQIYFQYERGITDKITYQIGLGNSYGIDPLLVFSSGLAVSQNQWNQNYLKLNSILTNGSLSGIFNPIISIDFKFFNGYWIFGNNWSAQTESSERFDGIYTQVGLRAIFNEIDLNGIYSGTNQNLESGNLKAGVQTYYVTLKSGRVFTTDGAFHTTHDFYIGLGLRAAFYDAIQQINSNTNSNQNTFLNIMGGNKQSSFAPAILLGYTLGFGF